MALALRLLRLAARDISDDENLAQLLIREPFWRLLPFVSFRPPLAFIIAKLAGYLPGTNGIWDLRLPGAIEGAAAVAVVYLIIHRRLGVFTARLAALFVACSPFCIYWSQDARYYPLLLLTCLLFAWALLAAIESPRWPRFAGAGLAALSVVWTHQSGYLFLAVCLASVTPLLLRPCILAHVRTRVRHAPWLYASGAIAVLAFAALLPLLSGRSFGAIRQALTGSMAGAPTPGFDIAPQFLLNRLAEIMGLPPSAAAVALLLACVGMAHTWRRSPALALVSMGAIALPWIALWVVRPQHPWHAKYFIYMAPFLAVLLARGIAATADAAVHLGSRSPRQGLRNLVMAGGAFGFLLANLIILMPEWRHPIQSQQKIAALLENTSQPGDILSWTFGNDWRVLQTYLNKEKVDLLLRPYLPDGPPFWKLDEAPRAWYIHTGKGSAPLEPSALVMSPLLSRMAFHASFLAFGPNLTEIRFGSNYPGAPNSAGPLTIAAGSTCAIELLVPESRQYAILLYTETTGAGAAVSAGPQSPSAPFQPCPSEPGALRASLELDAGRVSLSIANEGHAPIVVSHARVLPILGNEPLILPAWAFWTLTDSRGSDQPWIEDRNGLLFLRDIRQNQVLQYGFFVEHAQTVRFGLTALNDAPFENRYELGIVDGGLEGHTLAFGLENDRPSTLFSGSSTVGEGVRMLGLRYLAVPKETALARGRLRNGQFVNTHERWQEPGVSEIQIVPDRKSFEANRNTE